MAAGRLLEPRRIDDIVARQGAAGLGEMLVGFDGRLGVTVAAIAGTDLAVPPSIERDLHRLRGAAATLGLARLAVEIGGVERQVRGLGGEEDRVAALRSIRHDAALLAATVTLSRLELARLVPAIRQAGLGGTER